MDYLGWVMSQLRQHTELRASLSDDAATQARVAKQIPQLVAEALNQASLDDFLGEWDANIRPNPHIRLPDAAYDQLSPLQADSRIRLASLHRLSFSRQDGHFAFRAAGRLWSVPASLHPALARLHNARTNTLAELNAALTDPSASEDLVKSLTVLARAGVVLVEKTKPPARA
jgi:hypothetical protein